MFGVHQILVSAPARRRFARAGAALAAGLFLAACGQKGPLYLPTGEAAAGRKSLPQTLTPSGGVAPSTAVAPSSAASAPSTPPTGTAAPVRNP